MMVVNLEIIIKNNFINKHMTYKCPQCCHIAEQAGNCPTCNVPMNEVKEEIPSEPQKTEEIKEETPSGL